MTFDEFAESQIPRLLRTATAMSGDRILAEDLVQDVLVKTFAQWDKIEAKDDPGAYVGRMLTNEYLSWRRRWGRVVPTPRVGLDDTEPDPSIRYSESEHLTGLLAQLPRRQQVVLALRYFGGLTDREIAASMGCRESTVRAYAARALAALRPAQTQTKPASLGRDHQ